MNKSVKKYTPVSLKKECPFGTLHQKQCNNCRFAIKRLTDEEVAQMRRDGKFEQAVDEEYSCIIIGIFEEISDLKKAIRRLK